MKIPSQESKCYEKKNENRKFQRLFHEKTLF